MSNIIRAARTPGQKEFVKIFDSQTGRFGRWTIWSDFITLSAVSVSNAVDLIQKNERNKLWADIAKKYTRDELEGFSQMFYKMVDGMEEDPNQDFLGDLYMALGLGDDHAGQFFTPYNLCRCTAAINAGNVSQRVQMEEWISVNDPACGAGALLLAFANECRSRGVNYQQSVLFIAQDIDFTVALMCYLQLSLMGCPGYVIIGDTLSNPGRSVDGKGLIPAAGQNVWFTPLYFSAGWAARRFEAALKISAHGRSDVNSDAKRR